MKLNYIKNCFTCEFGFDNDHYDKEHNPVHPDVLIITCAGSNDFYGKEVKHDFCCKYWGESFSEFVRCQKGISYQDFYEDRLNLLPR